MYWTSTLLLGARNHRMCSSLRIHLFHHCVRNKSRAYHSDFSRGDADQPHCTIRPFVTIPKEWRSIRGFRGQKGGRRGPKRRTGGGGGRGVLTHPWQSLSDGLWGLKAVTTWTVSIHTTHYTPTYKRMHIGGGRIRKLAFENRSTLDYKKYFNDLVTTQCSSRMLLS